MREPGELWKLREHSVARARKAARSGDPEWLHDLRVALRRVSATAGALGERGVSRRAKTLVRSLSEDRQLEVDRQLLTRIAKLGRLSPDAATALAARWEKLAQRGARRGARVAEGQQLRALEKRARQLSDRKSRNAIERLERARRKAEAALAQSLEGKDDDALHRYRVGVKKARYLAEDLAALGLRRFAGNIEREKNLQEALGRWNDLRLFTRRLTESRNEAEERGAIGLVIELERLLAALEITVASARRTAVDASRAPEIASIAQRAAARR